MLNIDSMQINKYYVEWRCTEHGYWCLTLDKWRFIIKFNSKLQFDKIMAIRRWRRLHTQHGRHFYLYHVHLQFYTVFNIKMISSALLNNVAYPHALYCITSKQTCSANQLSYTKSVWHAGLDSIFNLNCSNHRIETLTALTYTHNNSEQSVFNIAKWPVLSIMAIGTH